MLHEFSRTELLIGQAGVERLRQAHVTVFGIGGVGSFVVEALARSGVGTFSLIDDDAVCKTNINRQIHATQDTIGLPKVEVMKKRILAINPEAQVHTWQEFYLPGSAENLLNKDYDYIVDAIDTVTAKLDLVVQAQALGVPIISCMGTGNKLDPTKFKVADIFETSVCPLARVMRKELRVRGVKKLKVVYSEEVPRYLAEEGASCHSHCICPKGTTRKCTARRQIPGSIAFMPSVAGLILAGEVVRDILEIK